jgi:hypothetical protein
MSNADLLARLRSLVAQCGADLDSASPDELAAVVVSNVFQPESIEIALLLAALWPNGTTMERDEGGRIKTPEDRQRDGQS